MFDRVPVTSPLVVIAMRSEKDVAGARAQLEQATQLLERVVAGFEPERLDADGALAYLALFAQLGKLAEAGQALAARRVDACGAYRRSGHQSAAHLVAATAGVGIDRAGTAVEVGKRLRDQPLADDAFRRGELSLDQAAPITEAAEVEPEAEAALVEVASRETVRNLRERARAVRLAAECDREERYERQRSLRTFRHGIDRDGMVSGHFRFPPDSGAAFVNRVEEEADRCYRAADRDRRHHEPHEQHAADALVALVTGTAAPSGRGAEVVVHVSRDALVRGSVAGGEVCAVEGVGDIPVAVARRPARRRLPQRCPRRRHRGPAGPALRAPRLGGRADRACGCRRVLDGGTVQCAVVGLRPAGRHRMGPHRTPRPRRPHRGRQPPTPLPLPPPREDRRPPGRATLTRRRRRGRG